MQAIADEAVDFRHFRGVFSSEEIGWIGAAATAQAIAIGAANRPLDDAHVHLPVLGLVAAHPRLIGLTGSAVELRVTVSDVVFRSAWNGSQSLLPAGQGVVAIVCLGWRGRLSISGRAFDCEPGAILIADRRVIADVIAINATGPIVAIAYGNTGELLPTPPDDCLWPSAWCVAG